MRCVLLDAFGDESLLRVGDAPAPACGTRDVRIRVRAAGVNRADLLQRQGHYPPPPGASEILGMECAGEIVAVGEEVDGWRVGERVMALIPGGGYAEEAVADAGSLMRVPDVLSDAEAGALPEVFLTVFLNVFLLAQAKRGEMLLVHGGGSGIGTAAILLGKLAGLRVAVTAGSREKCERCLALGADVAINYNEEDFVEKARGADVILDHIGARYMPRDLEALAVGGRVVVIGGMGGQKSAEVSVEQLLRKRLQIIGSTLRARPAAEKGALVTAFLERFGDDLNAGRVRPVIDRAFPLEQVAEAHRAMAADHFGKIVLTIA
jgi:putative PIG3 family NAD(P)H quinone oxidoreductase